MTKLQGLHPSLREQYRGDENGDKGPHEGNKDDIEVFLSNTKAMGPYGKARVSHHPLTRQIHQRELGSLSATASRRGNASLPFDRRACLSQQPTATGKQSIGEQLFVVLGGRRAAMVHQPPPPFRLNPACPTQLSTTTRTGAERRKGSHGGGGEGDERAALHPQDPAAAGVGAAVPAPLALAGEVAAAPLADAPDAEGERAALHPRHAAAAGVCAAVPAPLPLAHEVSAAPFRDATDATDAAVRADAARQSHAPGHRQHAGVPGGHRPSHQARPPRRLAPHHRVPQRQRLLLRLPHPQLRYRLPSPGFTPRFHLPRLVRTIPQTQTPVLDSQTSLSLRYFFSGHGEFCACPWHLPGSCTRSGCSSNSTNQSPELAIADTCTWRMPPSVS
ncbi:hypothetical protein GW17_00018386 [Ensete ventricosum]|nr:hypothetical protein GW17_00018386 [Ensete ventricosum]